MGIKEDLSPYIEIVEYKTFGAPVGECHGYLLGEKWIFDKLSFADQVLDGETYTVLQIEDIVKHDLCHLIANLSKEIDCGHNAYWQSICKQFNYSPSRILPILHYSLSLGSEIISDDKPQYKYILKCNRCGKIYRQSKEFSLGLFQHFLLCSCGHNMIYDGMPVKTECCKATYCYEADAEELLVNLKSEDTCHQIQKIIQRKIDNYK